MEILGLFFIFNVIALTISAQELAFEREQRTFFIKAKIPTVEDHNIGVFNIKRKLEKNLAKYMKSFELELKKLIEEKRRKDSENHRQEKEKAIEKQRDEFRSEIFHKHLASRVQGTSVLKDFYSRF